MKDKALSSLSLSMQRKASMSDGCSCRLSRGVAYFNLPGYYSPLKPIKEVLYKQYLFMLVDITFRT